MKLPPVLAALRKHKAGVVMIALEIALTLAIVCNAVFIIGLRIESVSRPTGLDESNLIVVQQQWVNAPPGDSKSSVAQRDSMQLEDLAALRRIPGVTDVAPVNSMPLLGSGIGWPLANKPFAKLVHTEFVPTIIYQTDQHGLPTLGLKLVAGRNFRADEIGNQPSELKMYEPEVILTRALAQRLFPHGDALGASVYFVGQGKPIRVIGIVAHMEIPYADYGNNMQGNSAIFPQRDDSAQTLYAIRTQPGQMTAVMKAIKPALFKVDPMRMMDSDSVQSFATIRAQANQGDVGMAIVMGVISLILIAITGAGIAGLSSFWVGQRTKQIGIRRALGATRAHILHYFQIENLLIVTGGVLLGAVFAYALNLFLMKRFELAHLPPHYLLIGAMAMWVLGQLAVLSPALRAAAVPPVVATRSV